MGGGTNFALYASGTGYSLQTHTTFAVKSAGATIANPGLLYLESTDPKLTRPSGSGNLAQNLTGHGNLGFALVPDKAVTMSLTVVLAIGMDSWLLTAHSMAWRSAGFIVVSARAVREAIDQFNAGDFDLVLLGDSVSKEDKQRLTVLIRASGSRTPVVSIANAPGDFDSFADATLKNDSGGLLMGIGELLAEHAKLRQSPIIVRPTAN
jgi:hypothetical protein